MPRRRSPRPDWIRERQIEVGRHIAALRRERGLSQEQLADMSGLDRRSVQRYENAQRDPGLADLLLLARALDVPAAVFLED